MKFSGELKFPELDHPGVPVQFVIEGAQAELVVEGESLGRWSLYDIHARRLVASAFQIDLEGTEVTFVADDPVDFAYRGVEHMAETWASLKSRRIASRSIAVRKSRNGTIPSRIVEMRAAMEANLAAQGAPRQIAGEVAMPDRQDAKSGDAAVSWEESSDSNWDMRDESAAIPLVGAESVPEPAVVSEPVSEPEPVAESEPEPEPEVAAPGRDVATEQAWLEEEKRRIAEERALLDEERLRAEQREADRIEAYRLEMTRLESERALLRQQAAELARREAMLRQEPEPQPEEARGTEVEPDPEEIFAAVPEDDFDAEHESETEPESEPESAEVPDAESEPESGEEPDAEPEAEPGEEPDGAGS